jgi:hypothetical protein
MQDLERDGAIVLAVLSEINRRHSATPELTINRVRTGERSAQALNWESQSILAGESARETILQRQAVKSMVSTGQVKASLGN